MKKYMKNCCKKIHKKYIEIVFCKCFYHFHFAVKLSTKFAFLVNSHRSHFRLVWQIFWLDWNPQMKKN